MSDKLTEIQILTLLKESEATFREYETVFDEQLEMIKSLQKKIIQLEAEVKRKRIYFSAS